MHKRFVGFVIPCLAGFACSGKASPSTTDPRVNCQTRVLATISNRRNVAFDVYYQEGNRPRTIIGEVAPSSTVTLTVPGLGTGRVTLGGRGGYVSERPGNPVPDVDIRLHCAG